MSSTRGLRPGMRQSASASQRRRAAARRSASSSLDQSSAHAGRPAARAAAPGAGSRSRSQPEVDHAAAGRRSLRRRSGGRTPRAEHRAVDRAPAAANAGSSRRSRSRSRCSAYALGVRVALAPDRACSARTSPRRPATAATSAALGIRQRWRNCARNSRRPVANRLAQLLAVVGEVEERRRRGELLPLEQHRRRRAEQQQRRQRAIAGRATSAGAAVARAPSWRPGRDSRGR